MNSGRSWTPIFLDVTKNKQPDAKTTVFVIPLGGGGKGKGSVVYVEVRKA